MNVTCPAPSEGACAEVFCVYSRICRMFGVGDSRRTGGSGGERHTETPGSGGGGFVLAARMAATAFLVLAATAMIPADDARAQRDDSTTSALSNIVLMSGSSLNSSQTLTPAFDPGTFSYSTVLPYNAGDQGIKVTATRDTANDRADILFCDADADATVSAVTTSGSESTIDITGIGPDVSTVLNMYVIAETVTTSPTCDTAFAAENAIDNDGDSGANGNVTLYSLDISVIPTVTMLKPNASTLRLTYASIPGTSGNPPAIVDFVSTILEFPTDVMLVNSQMIQTDNYTITIVRFNQFSQSDFTVVAGNDRRINLTINRGELIDAGNNQDLEIASLNVAMETFTITHVSTSLLTSGVRDSIPGAVTVTAIGSPLSCTVNVIPAATVEVTIPDTTTAYAEGPPPTGSIFEAGNGSVVITVSLDIAATVEVTLPFTIGTTGTHGTDYVVSSAECTNTAACAANAEDLVFAIGQQTKTITVTATDDTSADDGETVTVALATGTRNGVVVTADDSTVITIIDNFDASAQSEQVLSVIHFGEPALGGPGFTPEPRFDLFSASNTNFDVTTPDRTTGMGEFTFPAHVPVDAVLQLELSTLDANDFTVVTGTNNESGSLTVAPDTRVANGAFRSLNISGFTVGDNIVTIVVGAGETAAASTDRTYTITATNPGRPISTDATLSSLTVDGVPVGDFFHLISSGTCVVATPCAATIGSDASAIVDATPASTYAIITMITGVQGTSGPTALTYSDGDGNARTGVANRGQHDVTFNNLAVSGVNTITILVTAENGDTRTYTIAATTATPTAALTVPDAVAIESEDPDTESDDPGVFLITLRNLADSTTAVDIPYTLNTGTATFGADADFTAEATFSGTAAAVDLAASGTLNIPAAALSGGAGAGAGTVTITITPEADDVEEEGDESIILALTAPTAPTGITLTGSPATITLREITVEPEEVMDQVETVATVVGTTQVSSITGLIRARFFAVAGALLPGGAALPTNTAGGATTALHLPDNPQDLGDMLGGLGIEHTAEADGGGAYAVWVRGQYSSMEGDPTVNGITVDYDGDSTGIGGGVEKSTGRYVAGVAVNWLATDLDLASSSTSTTISNYEESLVMVAPYLSLRRGSRTFWLSAGYGIGETDAALEMNQGKASADVQVTFANAGADFVLNERGKNRLVGGVSVLGMRKVVDSLNFAAAKVIIPEITLNTFRGRGEVTYYRTVEAGEGRVVHPYIGLATLHDASDKINDDSHALDLRGGVNFDGARFDVSLEASTELLREDHESWTVSGNARYQLASGGRGASLALDGISGDASDIGLEGGYGMMMRQVHRDALLTPFAGVRHGSGGGEISSGMRFAVGGDMDADLKAVRRFSDDEDTLKLTVRRTF